MLQRFVSLLVFLFCLFFVFCCNVGFLVGFKPVRIRVADGECFFLCSNKHVSKFLRKKKTR